MAVDLEHITAARGIQVGAPFKVESCRKHSPAGKPGPLWGPATEPFARVALAARQVARTGGPPARHPSDFAGRDRNLPRFLGWFGTNLLCHWNGTNQILIRELRGTEFTQRGAVTVDSGLRPVRVVCDAVRQVLAWSEKFFSNSIFLASFATPGRRVELKGDVPGLVPILFSDDGNYLVACAPDFNSLRAWNVETGQILATIKKQKGDATLGAGGRVLVVPHSERSTHETVFYDLAHPERAPRRVPGRHISVELAVSPDGGLVACSTEGGVVQLFDPLKGELIENLHGHLNGAFGLAFSPNGRRSFCTSNGREAVKLWDVRTRQELLTMSGAGLPYVARWTADGDVILAGPPWQVWRAPSWEEIAAAEEKELAQNQQP